MAGWLTNGSQLYTPSTYTGVGAGSSQFPVDTEAGSGAAPQSAALPTSAGSQGLWATVSAAGATQGDATALTAFKNLITVATTASTHGVRLPAAATGLEISVGNNGTFGVKVYPATGDQIGANSTNAAFSTVLAINRVCRFLAVSGSKWLADIGN